ncbi:MAG TPA: glycosyltransferase family 4 protein [Anaerolineales bacterium]|nr:glycosyltransferase family 4 protein [Anaerolineales bacterium]
MPGSPVRLANRRIGFVSTRFAGTDGVSLETQKWATVLSRLGHTCVFFSGYSDWDTQVSRIVPEAFFGHPLIAAIGTSAFDNEWGADELLEFANPDIFPIHSRAFYHYLRPPRLTQRIHELKDYLKSQLYAWARDFQLELLIVQNALAIPMNIPLGLALTEFIAETGFPVIAHHHDFYWERQRFLVNCVADYLSMAFPPNLPSIHHVTINSVAAQQLAIRTGISSTLIPNVMDFNNPPPPDAYTQDMRPALGIEPGEYFFLQPTRVVQRKGIEHAIELARRIGLRSRLVISHASGDEGNDYEKRVRDFAVMLDVPVIFVSDIIQDRRGLTADGRKVYTLQDAYSHADLVTYPSSIEGFGNAFLEAIYYRRPIVVNNYSIFAVDIKPKGFRVIEFDGYITESAVQQTRRVLTHPEFARETAQHNYRLGKRYFSFTVLERHLQTLITDCFGEDQDV